MKTNSHYDGRDVAPRRPIGAARQFSQSGIALVITLILVSVIAFMAITFLVISQRERGSVSVAASQTDARLATETALQTATAKLLAPVIAYTNPFNYDLLVSTNYINPAGYFTGNNYPTNVNYDGVPANNPIEWARNIANLLYDPRPPVFVVTNKQTGSNDFRYYLDLNRNGRAEPSGFLAEMNNLNQPTGNTNFYVGDPEWIGVLERPELPHSANNRFIARYAYIAVPVGKTLDVNYIHNEAATRSLYKDDGYLRNQGVGSWEINLAAFFRDLNPDIWTYFYNQTNGSYNTGSAFEDAQVIVSNRYGSVYNDPTKTAAALFPGNGNVFTGDPIDRYSDGPLMTNTFNNGSDSFYEVNNNRWAGADNPNHYFSHQDLFTGTSPSFLSDLWQAGTSNASYDRYTFYRLLSQLGTDSAAESGKLNLNYLNVDSSGNIVPGAETNFVSWTPQQFFTNVAARLLTNYYGFDTNLTANLYDGTNIHIQIYPTNYYTPGVHRLLQLAANLYDATTSRFPLTNNLSAPSVFRPVFANTGTNIVITGYEEVANNTATLINTNIPFRDLNNPVDRAALATSGASDMVYGIPLVIGAKKGLPNFNALALQTAVRVTRKLNVYRPATNAPPNEIRQMYLLGISNVISVEAWNSYSNAYPLGLRIIAQADVTTVLTNENGIIPTTYGTGLASNRFTTGYSNFLAGGLWPGYDLRQSSKIKYSFTIPLTNFFWSLPNCSWQSLPVASSQGRFVSPPATNFNADGLTPPHWWMNVNTRLRFILVDAGSSRILDYVNLSSDADPLDIMHELSSDADCDANAANNSSAGGAWCTNQPGNSAYTNLPTHGILNQILASQGLIPMATWKNYIDDPSTGNDVGKSTNKFQAFMGPMFGGTNLVTQAPFSPFRTIYQYVSWQANDPLVHYMIPDLTDLLGVTKTLALDVPITALSPASMRALNTHYRPWGGKPLSTDTTPATDYHLELKDPLASNSDSWDFPTNKLPNIGWLGRVHRGTPWQTVYLKSAPVDTNTWKLWTGNTDDYDSALTQPQQDWRLFDLFTTAPNANATRGQLPVNQTGLAAWSAALSGVLVLDSNANPVVVQPAGASPESPELQTIVNGINNWRTSTNFNGITNTGSFTNLGGILAVPELTVNSPYLGGAGGNNIINKTNATMNDAVVERLPQQIMSLLRLGDQPRFVIYAYGQSLKPADHSIVQTAGFSGLCTNYQITGETAVRAVVRVENAPAAGGKSNGNPRVVIESYNALPPD